MKVLVGAVFLLAAAMFAIAWRTAHVEKRRRIPGIDRSDFIPGLAGLALSALGVLLLIAWNIWHLFTH